ncbi:hemicentin-2-like isoform X2 [Toxorhynchites rutilus septentrionalis]|uniref:hemicentin-2-like isoform X2 n=1 Tax=Toxorhynchites rutilus septentrionalis TaxID=329112 RepID=UPI0024799C70|nr:hemicentin-2-like isoform X2 [Toxorhynchites rutilus septentrionalis]
MKNRIRLTLDIWVLVVHVIDITSCGIQQNHPIDGHKSLPLETSTFQLSAYVAAASTSTAGGGHQQQQLQQLQHAGVPQSTGVGIGSVTKWEEPYFDDTTPRNVTALVGKSAYLSCRVKNLGNKTVSWIRHRDIHILTVGSYTYTSDQRFQATHHKNTDDWTLQIKWAQKRDAGIYECQISTQPVRSYFVTLKVVVPTATIIGGPDLHVDKGSTINLTCAVKYSPEPPAYIFWYHHDEVISYDSSRGGVSVITEKGDVTTSHLLIQNADLDDSGKYSCSPSNADVASVRVHVLNGEHPEAMQTGAATNLGSREPRFLLVAALGTVLAGWLLLVRWQTLSLSNWFWRQLAANGTTTSGERKSPSSHLSRSTSCSRFRQRKQQQHQQLLAQRIVEGETKRFVTAGGDAIDCCCPTALRWSGR